MAVIVVEFLEMIHVHRQNAYALPCARRPRKLAAAGLKHVAPVEHARQRIADRLIAQLFSEFCIGDGQADLFGADKAQPFLFRDGFLNLASP